MSKCCIFGLGYIGLPTAAIIANNGHKVHGVEINLEIINLVNDGKTNISEPGLSEVLKNAVYQGNFTAGKDPIESDIFIITVPTPFLKNENNEIPKPDLKFVMDTARSIAKVIKKGDLVLLESTSPVGTTEKVFKVINEITNLHLGEIFIAYCPERVIPGDILNEMIYNDRVVGGLNKESTEKGKSFYETFCKGKVRTTTSKTAELVKLAENAYRDVNIAYANEISLICNDQNINVYEMIKLANNHPRVNILNPSCGVGGHCIAIDPWFIAFNSPKQSKLIQQARKVNIEKTEWVFQNILELSSRTNFYKEGILSIGCLGLTYKADVDDIRESPAYEITKRLINKNIFNVLVNEPNLEKINFAKLSTIDEIKQNCQIITILVPHHEYKKLNWDNKIILDYCGLYE